MTCTRGAITGADAIVAALKAGPAGRVAGVDMTPAQLAKADRLRRQYDFRNVSYLERYIEETRLEGDTADCVISNGVMNLAPDKARVLREAACIGGAAQRDRYREELERAGFEVRDVQENREYRFISDRARSAT